jgi:hypothetical protein
MIAERLEIAPEVIEAQLAHAVPDALGRPVYVRVAQMAARPGHEQVLSTHTSPSARSRCPDRPHCCVERHAH